MLDQFSERAELLWGGGEFSMPGDAVVASHDIELAGIGTARVHVLLSSEREGRLVQVLTIGHRAPRPIVRIQSSCVYGETFGSTDCDCGDQLRRSLVRMRGAGSGVLVYLDQEGRGAGLAVKALAYQLAQRLQFDTLGAYDRLGLEHDRRSYVDAVRALRLLGVTACVLLTGNPAKLRALEEAGIATRREPL